MEKKECTKYSEDCTGCPYLKIINMLTIDENNNKYNEEIRICEFNEKIDSMKICESDEEIEE